MRFLAPSFSLFALLFVVPLVIHLVGRQRARRRPFAAIGLLLGTDRRVARWIRTREVLLLLVRAAAIAAIPLILARPFTERASDAQASIGAAESAVIVLDDSLSMRAVRGDGRTLFETARARALRLVADMNRDAEAALVLGSRGGGAKVAELTTDRGRLRRAIEDAEATERSTALTEALGTAAQILRSAAHERRRIYLLSDMAEHGFDSSPPWTAADGPEVAIINVAEGASLPNLAVTNIVITPAHELASVGPSAGIEIAVEATNFASTPLKNGAVTVEIDGQPVSRESLDLSASSRTVKSFFHAFDSSVHAVHWVSAAISAPRLAGVASPDVLKEDDRRWARIDNERGLRLLLVDGAPRSDRREDELFYLETALKPDPTRTAMRLTVTSVEALRDQRLAGQDAVFLCNPRAPFAVSALREFVRSGGGLFVSLGDNVDVEAWNQSLGDLLPEPLETVHSAAEPGESIGATATGHPLMAFFQNQGQSEPFGSARFKRYALLRPDPDRGATVLARFEGGAPALIERHLGRGRVLLFASSIDRDWNDLPIQPVFLPLVQQMATYLSGAPIERSPSTLKVGEAAEIALRDADRRAEAILPSGKTVRLEVSHDRAGTHAQLTATAQTGLYQVRAASGDGALEARPEASLVVNTNPAESNLGHIAPAELAKILRGSAAPTKIASPKHRVELWHAMGAALLALLLGEAVLLRFRLQR